MSLQDVMPLYWQAKACLPLNRKSLMSAVQHQEQYQEISYLVKGPYPPPCTAGADVASPSALGATLEPAADGRLEPALARVTTGFAALERPRIAVDATPFTAGKATREVARVMVGRAPMAAFRARIASESRVKNNAAVTPETRAIPQDKVQDKFRLTIDLFYRLWSPRYSVSQWTQDLI